jgi:mannose-6-phosphate isomerase-like protein (cupin superfamily)
MAHAGQVIEDPTSGDRIEFRRTAADTDGEALEYETLFHPRGFAVKEHLHPSQEERHELLEGSLTLVFGGTEHRLGPGDAVTVPPGTAHRLIPVDDSPVRVVFTSRPALRTEELLETLFELARAGKVKPSGMPGFLQLVAIGEEFAAEGYLTQPPRAVQKAASAVLGPIARLRGYRGTFPG